MQKKKNNFLLTKEDRIFLSFFFLLSIEHFYHMTGNILAKLLLKLP